MDDVERAPVGGGEPRRPPVGRRDAIARDLVDRQEHAAWGPPALAGGVEQPDAKAVQFESGNLETLQRIVDRGYGMTLLPWLAVQGQGSHAPESVRPFRAPAPSRTVRLVYATTLVRRQLVRAFAAEVARAAASDLPPESVLHGSEA